MSKDIKTEEKKQHFDDIYVAETPVPYKERILDGLHYISDNFNKQTFDRLILPWIQQQQGRGKINYLDLCACFGNTTMATVYGMSYEQICDNWKDATSCQTIQGQRRFECHTTAVDISENAMNYCKETGLFDETLVCDLNSRHGDIKQAVLQAMAQTDVLLSTAALVYLDLETIDELIQAFCRKPTEGYVLVNFLNPFALEKGDSTKRKLLQYLDFVGSTATRHRQLSPLEREHYPGEEWSLLELWVLRRRPSTAAAAAAAPS